MPSALESFMRAIAQIESGNNPRALGPRTRYGRATGKYQFLDSTWTRYGGYKSARDAPEAVQDARAAQLMSQYYQRYGRWDAVAAAWHGGPGAANRLIRNGSASSTDGIMSTDAYARKALSLMETTVAGSTRNPLMAIPAAGGSMVNITPSLVSSLANQMMQAFGLGSLGQWRSRAAKRGPGQAKNSDHYEGMAFDFSGTHEQMSQFAVWARQQTGFVKYVIYEGNPQHYKNHVHVSFKAKGVVPPNLFNTTSNLAQFAQSVSEPKFALTMADFAAMMAGPFAQRSYQPIRNQGINPQMVQVQPVKPSDITSEIFPDNTIYFPEPEPASPFPTVSNNRTILKQRGFNPNRRIPD